jgi:glycerophosphoryl diester phosphodiesterase
VVELERRGSGRPVVVGHRGARRDEPENTLASFERAIVLGADAIELDIQACRDGELVVIHDDTLDRTTDGSGRVVETPLAAIKRLDAGAWFSERRRGERVPTLREALEWARGTTDVAIELKGTPAPADGAVERIVELLDSLGMLARAMLISFDHASIRRVAEVAPQLATGMLYDRRLRNPIRLATALGAASIRPSWRRWSTRLARRVHGAGLSSSAWTVNDEAAMRQLIAMRLDSIVTDDPGLLSRLLTLPAG